MTWCMEPEHERKLRELREEFDRYRASTDATIAAQTAKITELKQEIRIMKLRN